ncbi:fungal-specific transcription factor domain-containing protein [Aspergillus cavernicola]|uniref:Fungal-specific transcription factor domain-containing protein n=1 Tax=Aspergillus cavernicola TaxID=176166 RepID=A0ABR4I0Q4_9EURO
MSASRRRTCHACNRTFSKAEHLTRHLRSHTKERPYECSICGKLYSRSDVLRRHEKSHQDAAPQAGEQLVCDVPVLTPVSQEAPKGPTVMADCPANTGGISSQSLEVDGPQVVNTQSALGMNLHDRVLHADSSSWFLGTGLDVDALDFTLSSAVSSWARIPSMPSISSMGDYGTFYTPTPTHTRSIPEAHDLPADNVKRKWFTRLSVLEEAQASQTAFSIRGDFFGQGNIAADENYRAGLSQRLQPQMHDEALPSSDQLNLFANLFFSRFHSLLPVVHVPSFKPTTENSLLFVSICSVGSLFVGSSYAVAQGTRLFERLNKAILASWESILSHSCSDALSMVQAAIIGQTFAILSGRPRDLVLADVLHGTVMAWARESNKNALPPPSDPEIMFTNDADIDEQWSRWIDQEQRKRVDIALNIHDAELASLLHHEPIRKHRLTQYPCLASDALFMASTAARWAELYRETTTHPAPLAGVKDPLLAGAADSKFTAYGVLESLNAHIIEARQSHVFDEHESRRLSNMLMQWWRKYSHHIFEHEDDDPFCLPVLWHSVYMTIYADMDLLEQASGRDGQCVATASSSRVRSWSNSLDASRCLVHAILVQHYLERMRVSSEPAIHVPRSLLYAALSWFCFTRIAGRQVIDVKAFDAPEIQLLGSSHMTPLAALTKAIRESASTDVNHLHRLIDLLNRVGRWAISYSFAYVLCAALENEQRA